VDHAVDVGADPPLVAVVERLEGVVVARADSRHQSVIVSGVGRGARRYGCDS
jgi:hypothetical protein